MATLLDSEAQFKSRASEIGLSEDNVDSIRQYGVKTLSQLAFAVGQPGQPVSAADIDGFLRGALQRAPTITEAAAVRRLAFESQTILVASLRQLVEQKDDGQPRKIGAAERETRMADIKRSLGGIRIVDECEPSHNLLDRCCQIHETNSIKYIEPATCTSRSVEVQGGVKTKELAFEAGALVMRDKEDKTQVPTTTEMQLHYALLRRGIGFQFARLMTFEQHSIWTSYLFSALQRDPPPGYSRPSLHQLVSCDKAAFARLGSLVSSVRMKPDGTFPMGEALLELRNDPAIALHLSPLAKTGSQAPPPRPSPYPASQSAPFQAKSKGKGKKGKTPPMPAELRNKWHRTQNGEPLCFGFNTSKGCPSGVADGQRCSRGWHLCAEPKCLQPHSMLQHAKKAGA